MKRILLAVAAAAAFFTTVGVTPVTSTTAEARPWVRAGVRFAVPPYRPYYNRPYRYYGGYGGYNQPYYYGGYYQPYYSGYYYSW